MPCNGRFGITPRRRLNQASRSWSSVVSLEIVGLRPASNHLIRCEGSSHANFFRARPIVFGAIPVAIATAAIPP